MSRATCYIFGAKKEHVGKELHLFLRFFAAYSAILASLRPDFRLEYSCSCISLIEDIYVSVFLCATKGI